MTIEPIHRYLLAVVGVLLVATVAGLVTLWPRTGDLPGSEPLPPLVTGEVIHSEAVAAGGASADGVPDPLTEIASEQVTVTVAILDGPDTGEEFELTVAAQGYPDFVPGDRVHLQKAEDGEGGTSYFITDFERLPTLLVLVGIFSLAVLAVGRWHGLRSLLGLLVSLVLVVRFVVPAILAGSPPPLVALVGAFAVMIVTLYLAHGVNEMTTAAVIGTSASLALTVGLGAVIIDRGKITGFASEDATFASFTLQGLDVQGLVLAGLIIAALGVLDDVTVSQASTVFALHDADRQQTWRLLFSRAMKVGRDHIASVVNTLFLAYAGASLALLVVFSTGGLPVGELVNSEIIATEIVKTVVGSLGLIAAVPMTTALAATVAVRRSHPRSPQGDIRPHTDRGATP